MFAGVADVWFGFRLSLGSAYSFEHWKLLLAAYRSVYSYSYRGRHVIGEDSYSYITVTGLPTVSNSSAYNYRSAYSCSYKFAAVSNRSVYSYGSAYSYRSVYSYKSAYSTVTSLPTVQLQVCLQNC